MPKNRVVLLLNQRMRFPIGEWLQAENHPTKGFKERPGFHCTLEPIAPHLSTKGRVWVEVEMDDIEFYERPVNQGGTWALAQKMKVIKEL